MLPTRKKIFNIYFMKKTCLTFLRCCAVTSYLYFLQLLEKVQTKFKIWKIIKLYFSKYLEKENIKSNFHNMLVLISMIPLQHSNINEDASFQKLNLEICF